MYETDRRAQTESINEGFQSIITIHTFKKSSLMYGSFSDRDCFVKNFHFDAICNITQEPQELTVKQRLKNCTCGFIGKSAMIKYHQLLSQDILVLTAMCSPSIVLINLIITFFIQLFQVVVPVRAEPCSSLQASLIDL